MASITKRNGKYFVQVRKLGHSQSKTFTQRRDAETWAKQVELDLERTDLPQNPRKQLQGLTLGQLVERYRDTVSPRKKSAKNEQIFLNAFLRHDLAKKAVADIRVQHFSKYRDARLESISAISLKRELAILQNVFEIGKTEFGLPLKINPVADLKFSAQTVKRDRTLETGELEAILDDARQRKNLFILPIILFAIETGMRLGEIVNMQWDHLDLKNRMLLIPETKNGTPRKIPLTRKAQEVLEGIDPIGDFIFPVTANLLKLTWKRILQRVGIADLHFHDLRHTCITALFDKGLHIGEVSAISGHKTWSQLKTYTNPRPESILRKLDAFDGRAS
ncbi:MAG: site-specific integrase [Rhodomicrobium sp.]